MLFSLKTLCGITLSTIVCSGLLAAEIPDPTAVIINPAKGNFIYTIKVSEEAMRLIKKLKPLAEKLKAPKPPTGEAIPQITVDFAKGSNEFFVFEALRILVKERLNFDKFLPLLLAADLSCLTAFICLAGSEALQFDVLTYALRTGNKELLRRFVELFGISPNLKDKHNEAMLFYAIRNKQPEVVKYLVEHGASIAEKSREGRTVLEEADKWDTSTNQEDRDRYSAIKQFLISKGAVYSPKYQDLKNLLFANLIANNLGKESIKRLLKYDKIDINTKTYDEAGTTPLMIAAQRGLPDIVALLLRYGARVADTNVMGLDAEKMARQALSERKEQLKRPNITEPEKQQKLTETGNYQKVLNAFTNYALKEFVCISREEVSLSAKR